MAATKTKKSTTTTMDRKPKAKKKTKGEIAQDLYKFKVGIAIALGIAIPALSISVSHIAGTLASEVPLLAIFMGVCGVSVLYVSLSHLAEAIQDTTGSTTRLAWSMAVLLDFAIVGCELTHVYSHNAELWWWATGLMLVTMLFSMVLYVYAFLKHVK